MAKSTMQPSVHQSLAGMLVPIDSVVPDPGNARKHNEKNVSAVLRSLEEFGQRIPIVVQKRGMIIRAGNARYAAARILGWTHIAAVIIDEDDTSAKAFAITDNRSAELSTWDNDALAKILSDLVSEDGFDASITGFTDDDIRDIVSGPAVVHGSGGQGGFTGQVFSHTCRFDTREQYEAWLAFVRMLNEEYSDLETIGARVVKFVSDHPACVP